MKFHKYVIVDIEARELGHRLSKENSEIQAKFFEGLREGFAQFSKGDKDGYQMLHIKDELSMATIAFIKKMAEYICEK